MIPATEIADELGNRRMANLVLLGALLQRIDVLTLQEVAESLRHHIPEHRRNLLEGNLEALKRGASLAAGVAVKE
jgi:2-oxoglutarate ferredoxin oxidoreductase subunit gamma